MPLPTGIYDIGPDSYNITLLDEPTNNYMITEVPPVPLDVPGSVSYFQWKNLQGLEEVHNGLQRVAPGSDWNTTRAHSVQEGGEGFGFMADFISYHVSFALVDADQVAPYQVTADDTFSVLFSPVNSTLYRAFYGPTLVYTGQPVTGQRCGMRVNNGAVEVYLGDDVVYTYAETPPTNMRLSVQMFNGIVPNIAQPYNV